MMRAEQRFDTSTGPSRIRTRGSAEGRRAARCAATRKRREEQGLLDGVRTEAEAAARSRPVLLSLLSHDLRTPLSVMMIGTHSLGRALPADHPARRHLDMLKRNAGELLQMLEATSEAARIERGTVSLAMGREDAGELIAAAREGVQRHAQDRNITLDVSVSEGVPPVLCAREKMVRVLGGLLARAVRVSPKNGAVTIQVDPDEEGGARISITDHAPSIPEEQAEAAFELPRDESDRRILAQSFVLDLFVARGLVEAYGGRIWLERGDDHGNTFVLVLPSEV
ncbi:MAG: HAMP domain-containing sensor histidine kinase [Minicystis sp.]